MAHESEPIPPIDAEVLKKIGDDFPLMGHYHEETFHIDPKKVKVLAGQLLFSMRPESAAIFEPAEGEAARILDEGGDPFAF